MMIKARSGKTLLAGICIAALGCSDISTEARLSVADLQTELQTSLDGGPFLGPALG